MVTLCKVFVGNSSTASDRLRDIGQVAASNIFCGKIDGKDVRLIVDQTSLVKTYLLYRSVCCNETWSKYVLLIADTKDIEEGLHIGWIDVKVRRKFNLMIL